MTETIAPTLVEIVRERLAAGRRVRRFLPNRGVLNVDRPLPFLVVYRRPADRPDPGTDQLVLAESAHLIAPGGEMTQLAVGELVAAVVETLAGQFNAFLLLELWAGTSIAKGDARPQFIVHLPPEDAPRPTVAAMVRGLRNVALPTGRPKVALVQGGHAPPGLSSLLTIEQAKRHTCLMLGLEVPPVYRDPATGALYPRMLRRLHRGLSRAMQQAFFAFARVQTRTTVEHYQSLGRRAVGKAVWEVDRQLAEVSEAFDLLLAATPVNAPQARAAFEASGGRDEPVFHYRLLTIDPDQLKRKLYAITIERVEDPALAELFRAKRAELDRQITMLEDRETRRFFYGSMQLYDGVDDTLLGMAEHVLAKLPARVDAGGGIARAAATADALAFAGRARDTIDAYRQTDAAMAGTVEVRDDVPGLLVSDGKLLIGQDLDVPAERVEPLIAHEVGTHLLTYYNGGAQPLTLLRGGLAGYEELQEGLAVLGEWLVGGLSRARLRLLAGRVVAVRRLCEGAPFAQVYRELREGHGFTAGAAFGIAMRVFRGGGLTKDAIYLRGLAGLLDHLRNNDGGLDELFVGKISLESLPVVRELRWREVLREPPLRPRHLDSPAAADKLRRLRDGVALGDLLDGGPG